MFKHLFDLSYERDLDDAIVFYFFYFILAYFISGVLNSCANFFFFINTSLTKFFFYLIGFVPFFFYMFLTAAIIMKKKLKRQDGVYLIFCTIITLLTPLFIGICFGFGFLGYHGGFKVGILGTFMELFFTNLAIGGIPVAILTTKEDFSLNKEIQKMEQEKLEHEQWVEKQLLSERAIASKSEEIKKHTNNTKKEEGQNEE